MSIFIKGWTDNGEKQIKIMNREGIATADEDMATGTRQDFIKS
jgi:hypothetical protein